MEYRTPMINTLLDSAEIWKQKEEEHKAILLGMIERRIADPASVTLHAVDVMMDNVRNDRLQQTYKESNVSELTGGF